MLGACRPPEEGQGDFADVAKDAKSSKDGDLRFISALSSRDVS